MTVNSITRRRQFRTRCYILSKSMQTALSTNGRWRGSPRQQPWPALRLEEREIWQSDPPEEEKQHLDQAWEDALDVERCPVEGSFGGGQVREAIEAHVLGQASITGTYSLNPDVPA